MRQPCSHTQPWNGGGNDPTSQMNVWMGVSHCTRCRLLMITSKSLGYRPVTVNCIVLKCNAAKRRKKKRNQKSHALQPLNSRQNLYFSFFSVLRDLPKSLKEKQSWLMCLTYVWAGNYFKTWYWMNNKQRWYMETSPSAIIPHQYNLLIYFQYLHGCTQNTLKKVFFFFSVFFFFW